MSAQYRLSTVLYIEPIHYPTPNVAPAKLQGPLFYWDDSVAVSQKAEGHGVTNEFSDLTPGRGGIVRAVLRSEFFLFLATFLSLYSCTFCNFVLM